MTRSRNARTPAYRAMLRSSWRGENLPTCVVAGPDRHRTWLYVHAPSPTILRLHPRVVRFLLDALGDLSASTTGDTACLRLPKNTSVSYPECIIIRHHNEQAWLYVLAATPSAVRLAPPVVKFLMDILAELPALAGSP